MFFDKSNPNGICAHLRDLWGNKKHPERFFFSQPQPQPSGRAAAPADESPDERAGKGVILNDGFFLPVAFFLRWRVDVGQLHAAYELSGVVAGASQLVAHARLLEGALGGHHDAQAVYVVGHHVARAVLGAGAEAHAERPQAVDVHDLGVEQVARITSAIDQSTASMSDWVTVEACDTSSASCLLVIVPVGTILAYHLP